MKRDLDKLKHAYFDFLIIGGGITGSTIAWDATLRGYSVAVIEKKDFGHATSMATSKLIHGGLRYLENFNLGLVRESLRERRYLSDIISHQVRPLPFLMPLYKTDIFSKYYLKAGLSLYDMLSFDKNMVHDKSKVLKNHRWLSAKKALELEPNLAKDDLAGAFCYYDMQNVHPERINIDFLLSATSRGAVVANYLEVVDVLSNQIAGKKKACGVKVTDKTQRGEDDFIISAKSVINCSGPWIQRVLGKTKISSSPKVVLSKGIHLIMPRRQNDQAIFIQTKDNNHLLILPWLNYTLLGTTDSKYDASPDDVHVTKQEAKNFLQLVNQYYPVDYKFEEIVHSYVGLRTLLAPSDPDNNKTYQLSRDHKIVDHSLDGMSGLVSVVGGKYTTARSLAEEVVDQVQSKYKIGNAICSTKTTLLSSANYSMNLDQYKQETYKHFDMKYSSELLDYLIEYYGVYAQKVILLMEQNKLLAKKIHPSSQRVFAEIEYAIQNESALTLSDMLYRRCGWGNEGLKNKTIIISIAEYMRKALDWSQARLKEEISGYLASTQIY